MHALSIWKQAPRPVKLLLVSMLLVNMGFYALIPYLSLYVTSSFAWSLALTGIMLATRQIAEQGLAFFGGLISDRWGSKMVLVIGLAIRSIGFLSFALCWEVWHFFVAAILSGLGGALFGPAMQSMFTRLSPKSQLQSLFSFKNMISNIGIAASTLVGSLLSSLDFYYLSLAVGLVFVFLTILVLVELPNIMREEPKNSIRKDFIHIIRDYPFIIYTFVTIGFYYLYMQLFLTIPKHAAKIVNSQYGVAYIMTVISLTVVFLQLRVSNLLKNVHNRFWTISAGTLILGIGLFLIGISSNLVTLGVAGLLFAIGSMIAMPVMLDIVPMFSPNRLLASYFGFFGYSMAIGGALSTSLGGYMYDLGERMGRPILSWLFCLIIAIIVSISLLPFKDRNW